MIAVMSSLALIISTVTRALARYEMVTPASRSTKMSMRPRRRAAIQTMTSVPRPPTMASTVIHGRLERCSTMPMVAPSAAPDETPVTYGSVSGLRKRSWRITPATASAAPTSAAMSTRGMRICQKMALSRSPLTGPAISRCQIRPTDSEAGPRASASTRHTTKDAGGQEDPRPHACAGEPGHWAASASGWIMPASCLQALGQARAGTGDDAVLDHVDLAVLDGGELGEAGALARCRRARSSSRSRRCRPPGPS